MELTGTKQLKLDVETELANILSEKCLKLIEVVRTISYSEKGVDTTNGIFDLDTDSNGRWSVERFKGLMFN